MENGLYCGVFKGKNGLMGFKKGQSYTFKLTHPPNSTYLLEELQENLSINYASEISIKQNWSNLNKED